MNITTRMLAAAIAFTGLSATAATTVDIDLGKKGAPVAPTMYGLFFEDINYAADGGLYAEKIKNRSFEFPQPFT
ncbi:MAG: alpha-L-arabinofuranosidase, partial [Muribaculum sp.]|nr:alpha-L-arabinofuranosidase [Muribaculum sp.]